MLLAIALSILLLAGLWLLTDRTITKTMEASAQAGVDVDVAGLVDIYASGGRADLEQRIADRLALTPIDGSTPHYLLSTDAGVPIAGDIASWPRLDPAVSESGYIRIGEGTMAFARATRLDEDLRLVVAHEAADGSPLRNRVTLVFLAGGALFVLIVGLFGRFAAGRLHRRIARINDALRDPDGDTVQLSTSSTGPDEIDELATHSHAALARTRRLMEAYRDTSDQVAHEIRTPLMHLDSRLVKALKASPSPEVAERLLEARTEIRRLVTTLESLLDIAASKARQGEKASLRPLNFSAMTQGICELYADSAEESGHHFTWQISPDVNFDAEETQISRLVTNLLDNAFKYVPAGGTVELTLSAGPRLVVADDGPGIPKEDRVRIFDRFYRSSGNNDDLPGSGLGLALAQAIAQRHGMILSLEDTDTGARFVLSDHET